MKKSTIALMFLLVGWGGFMFTNGPVEGLRFFFLLIGLAGLSYLMTPRSKGRKTRSKV